MLARPWVPSPLKWENSCDGSTPFYLSGHCVDHLPIKCLLRRIHTLSPLQLRKCPAYSSLLYAVPPLTVIVFIFSFLRLNFFYFLFYLISSSLLSPHCVACTSYVLSASFALPPPFPTVLSLFTFTKQNCRARQGGEAAGGKEQTPPRTLTKKHMW